MSLLVKAETFLRVNHSPHDNGHQSHNGFIQTVEEVSQRSTLLFHVSNDETEAHGEHHQTQSIDSIHCSQNRYHLLMFDFI